MEQELDCYYEPNFHMDTITIHCDAMHKVKYYFSLQFHNIAILTNNNSDFFRIELRNALKTLWKQPRKSYSKKHLSFQMAIIALLK